MSDKLKHLILTRDAKDFVRGVISQSNLQGNNDVVLDYHIDQKHELSFTATSDRTGHSLSRVPFPSHYYHTMH